MESNPGKFRLGESELKERKDFVERTRSSVQVKCSFDFCQGFFFLCSMYSMFCVRLSSYGCLSGLRLIISGTFILVTHKHCLEGCRRDLAATVFHAKTQTVPQTKSEQSGQLILLLFSLHNLSVHLFHYSFIDFIAVTLLCHSDHHIYLQQLFP